MRDRIRRLEASNKELLEALEKARDFIQTGIGFGFVKTKCFGTGLSMDSICEMLDKFDQVIKKAKGHEDDKKENQV